uniref:Reverse transcriptase domain-containing protein n=1 Tax=Tanacetum cinerariifolium TaxID=118510 RepID=A0A699KJR7_TANCI|nr:reverse transcriptase domain-containing protein [Tanacetum cinerariifolium]
MSSSTPIISSDVAELKDMVRALLLDKKNQSPTPTPSTTPAPVKAVEAICVTCGGTLPGNTVTNPKEDLKGITTQSGVAYQGPKTPSPSKQETKEKLSEMARTTMNEHCSAVILNELPRKLGDPGKFLIPCEFSGMDECLALADLSASINLMPLSVWEGLSLPELTPTCMSLELTDRSVSKPIALIGNKEKLSKMARTTMNEHCSAVILNKFPRKLGDPGKFLIPCEFPEMDECLALADLGASINLMPLSVWEGLSLPELTPTCMTLELADRSVSKPIGGLTLRIGNEAITYNLDQTVRYSANYNQMTANKIDVVEEYSREVLGFSNVTDCGISTPQNEPIVSVTSPTVTPFGDSDFLLFEEADAFLGLEDDPDSLKINPFYYDLEGDILLLEAILNSEPSPPLPNQDQNLPYLELAT